MFTILCILAALSFVIGLWYRRRIEIQPDRVGCWPRRIQGFQTSDGKFFTDPNVAREHQAHINSAYYKLTDDRLR